MAYISNTIKKKEVNDDVTVFSERFWNVHVLFVLYSCFDCIRSKMPQIETSCLSVVRNLYNRWQSDSDKQTSLTESSAFCFDNVVVTITFKLWGVSKLWVS